MEKKQTVVEWFYQRILSKDIKAVFEQAKEMEKQQIIDAFKRAAINEMNGIEELNSEQYYNETFKQD